MKIADIVTQLQLVLPKYTDKLSTSLSISTVSVTSNVATITTLAVHGMATGAPLTISNVVTHTAISAVSKDGNLYTFTTTNAHDLTLDWQETVQLSGFTDTAWNDTALTIIAVPDRNNFTVRSTNTLPTLNGNDVLLENRIDGINGRHQATVLNTTSLTITGTFLDGIYSGGTIDKGVRIAGAVSIERAIEQYTEQKFIDLWGFVVPNDIDVSKDRNAFSDVTASKGSSDDIRMKIIDGFTVTFIINTANEIAAVNSIDICRHDLMLPLMKSTFGARYTTGLSGAMDYKAIPTSAGIALYNKAILAYTYAFEVPYEITNDDAVEDLDTRAFRDIDYTHTIDDNDTEDLTITQIKLDGGT